MAVRSVSRARARRAPALAPVTDRLVLVAAGAGAAARAAAAAHVGSAGRVLAADAPDLADRLSRAAEVHVLDPGRLQAWRNRRRRDDVAAAAMTAPMAGAERLALLGRLRPIAADVSWVTRSEDLRPWCHLRTP